MTKDRRAARRRGLSWQALMIDTAGSIVGQCTIANVSTSGAKLVLQQVTEVPKSFVLVLSKNGGVRRRCELSWQTETEVGVKFLRPQRSEQSAVSKFNLALAQFTAKKNGSPPDVEAAVPG